MKVNKHRALTGTVVALFILSALDSYIDGARYLKYLIPPICLIYALAAKSRLQLNDPGVRAFTFLAVYTLVMVPFGNKYGLHDAYFYLTFLAPFAVGLKPEIKVETLFFILCAVFFSVQLPKVMSGGLAYSLIDSSSAFEDHTFSFVIGLFAVFFLISGKRSLFIIAILLAALSLKRISLLAIALCAIAYLFMGKSKKPLSALVIVAVVGNCLYVAFSYFVTTAAFNDLSVQYFGVNASHLTMGRNTLYSQVFYDASSSIINKLFGHGAGDSYLVAATSIFVQNGKVNLHNDILKIYYELGWVALITFIAILYRYKTKAIYLALYLNVIFLTDNISTYPLVVFVFLALCFYIGEEYKENTVPARREGLNNIRGVSL